jgi:hypothetical protein
MVIPDLHRLATALGGEVSNDQILAPGPNHSKQDRSLSVKLDAGAPDGFLVHSFAGDDPIVCKDHVRKLGGLPEFKSNGQRRRRSSDEVAQLLHAAVLSQQQEKPKGCLVATYQYVDADGALLYEVLRYEPKTFRQRKPNGNGGWIWNLDGVRRVPYRLPDLIKYPFGTAIIAEGEKDADRLAVHDLCATTAASGAWDGVDVSVFAGRDVMIMEDNDDTGREKSAKAAAALQGTAATIRIVRLSGLPEHGDVSDWLDAGHRADELVDVCFATPLWSPGQTPPIPSAATSSSSSPTIASAAPPTNKIASGRIPLIPFDEIRLGTERRYLVKGLIPREGITIVWGPPKSGKSFWVTDLALHVALARDYRRHKVVGGAVIYCAFEGAFGFRARIEAFRQQFLTASTSSIPFYLEPVTIDLVKDHAALITAIRGKLGNAAPVLVCLDTLNRSLAGSESSEEDMSAYVRSADAIRDAFSCAVIIIHHCGIAGDRPRGHTSLTGAAEAQLAVNRDATNNVIVQVEHMKDGAEGETVTSRLQPIEVGADDDNDPISSCVVIEVETSTAAVKATKLAPAARAGLTALFECAADLGQVPPASEHIPKGVTCVTLDQWRDYLQKRGVINPEGSPREQFRRIRVTLSNAGAIGIWDTFAWPVT